MLAVALLGCSDDDDAEPEAPALEESTGAADGCLLGEAIVTEAMGYAMRIEPRSDCSFVALDQDLHAGARVEVVEDDATALDDAIARLEREVGPVDALPDDFVDGADDGYFVHLGRSVQVAAVDDDRLVTLTLTEPLLSPEDALERAGDLLERALG